MGKKHRKKNKQIVPKVAELLLKADNEESRQEQSKEDFISRLPDDILCRITSLLPYKSAVKTGLLSTRWRDLWKMTSVQIGAIEDAVVAISSWLIDFGVNDLDLNPSKRGLQFHFGKDNVLLASVSPRNKLHLDFSKGKQEFPRQFGWLLELNQQINIPAQHSSSSSPSTFCVKTLYLLSVAFNTNEAVSALVSNLPFLESLTIAKCNGLRSLRITASSRLLQITILDCLQLKSIRTGAFKLQSFRYRGLLPWFWPTYHLHLVDAMLDFRLGPGYRGFRSRDFDTTLLSIKKVRTLTMCGWIFEELILPLLPSLRLDFRFHELKDLWWIDNSMEEHQGSYVYLISFLKLCPSLERLLVRVDPESYDMGSKELSAAEDYTTRLEGSKVLKDLKWVKLEGFRDERDEVLLAKQLKELASGEPNIIVASEGGRHRRLVSKKVEKSHEDKFSLEFVEDTRYSNESYSKHAHLRI